VYSHSVNNYYVVTFVLEKASLKTGPILSLKHSVLNCNTVVPKSYIIGKYLTHCVIQQYMERSIKSMNLNVIHHRQNPVVV
jgi:hypothetical protein